MTVTVSAKGQIVIPAKIRKYYHLKPHTKLDILDTGTSIILEPVSKGDPFLASYGFLKGMITTEEFLKMRRAEKEKEEKKLGKL